MLKKCLPFVLLIGFLIMAGCDSGQSGSPSEPASAPSAGTDSPAPEKPAEEAAPAEPAAESEAEQSPVVASVNGTPISRQMLESQVVMAESGRLIFGDEESKTDQERAAEDLALRLEVFNNLVGMELASQEAIRRGYRPADEEVEAAFEELKSGYDGAETLYKVLDQYGTTEEELRSQLIKSMALKKWHENDFLAQIKVDDDEARAFYDQHPTIGEHDDLVRISQIFLSVPLGSAGDQKVKAKERGEKALARIKAGEDFGTVAADVSDAPNAAASRGDSGWLRKGQSVGMFEEDIAGLRPGEMTGLLESPMGYHLFTVTEDKPAGRESFDSIKADIKDYLSGVKLEEALRNKMVSLYGAADIQIFDPVLKAAFEADREKQLSGMVQGEIKAPAGGE